MSHITRIRTNLKDVEMLKRVMTDLGYQVSDKRQKIKGYGQTSTQVDLKVVMPSGYHFGFTKAADGTYEIVGDFWGVKGVNQQGLNRQITQQTEKIEEEARRLAEEARLRMEAEIKEAQRVVKQQYTLNKVKEELRYKGLIIEEIEERADKSIVMKVIA